MDGKVDFQKILPTGKASRISTQELENITGLTSRELRKEIAKARAEGELIMSSTTGGYFLPADRTEVEECYRSLRARGINILKAAKGAFRWLKEADVPGYHQKTIEEFLDEIEGEI